MPLAIEKKRKPRAEEWIGDGKPHPGRRMTEAEFVEWCDEDTRAEWVDGEVIVIPPNSSEHDDVHFGVKSGMGMLSLKTRQGVVKGDNFQVQLPNQKRRRTPDLVFITKDRLDIVKENYCDGAPDLILEIVSRESTARDWREKFTEYEKNGVREYWIVDPVSKRIEAHELIGGKYRAIKETDGKLRSKVLKGFYLRRAWILRKTFPDPIAIVTELNIF